MTMLSAEFLCELPLTYRPSTFRVKWADTAWEIVQARALRRDVFCTEQGLFEDNDIDSIDSHAQTLVALSYLGAMPDQVVGTVRIHTTEAGVWWGSRLAVERDYRHHGGLGATLIKLAVSSAHARGSKIFLAHVQSQNTPFFERLQWTALQHLDLHGHPHDLMQADLQHYPPCYDPIQGLAVPRKKMA
jgi:putative N-acetyltransferase (TIGR04045 family)